MATTDTSTLPDWLKGGLPPWLKSSSGNAALNDPSAVDFLNNPDDLVTAGLAGMHQSLGNPFTKYLSSNLGGSALNTLYNLFDTPTTSNNANDFASFGNQLLSSFYNKDTKAPAGLDFSNPLLTGSILNNLITGTGDTANSVIGSAFKVGSGIDDPTLFNELGSIIDTVGSFSMNSLAKTIAKNQLQNIWGNYINSGGLSQSGGNFATYLAGNAADWLFQNFGVNLGPSSTPATTTDNGQ